MHQTCVRYINIWSPVYCIFCLLLWLIICWSSGTEYANLIPLSLQGAGSSWWLFYVQSVKIMKTEGDTSSSNLYQSPSFQDFPAVSVISYIGQAVHLSPSAPDLLTLRLFLLKLRKPSGVLPSWELRWIWGKSGTCLFVEDQVQGLKIVVRNVWNKQLLQPPEDRSGWPVQK